MSSLVEYWPSLLRGTATTIYVALASIGGAAVVSLVLGLLRVSRNRVLRLVSAFAVEFFRGASALVFLFWVYYAMPLIPGLPRFGDPTVAAIATLALVGGAYGAEIVRGAIISVPRGQWDAFQALGMTPTQGLVKIIVPQALTQVVPSFGSLAVDMVKWTSIVSFVGVQDLLYVGNSIRALTYQTVTIFSLLAATYWILCLMTSSFFRFVETLLPLNRALHRIQQSKIAAQAQPLSASPV